MLTVHDLFAGAGGSSTGMTQIDGVRVGVAANHWQLAADVHNANHPDTDHLVADISQYDPRRLPHADILWASPECTNHSQAKGRRRILDGRQPDLFGEILPDEAAERSRATMWDVVRFAEVHRYQAVIVENVVDVAKWAPIDGWFMAMDALGYRHRVVSLNSMHAQAGGLPAPQSRDRWYCVFWRKGNPAPELERTQRPRAYCPRCDAVVESRQAWKQGRTVGRYRQQYVYQCPADGTNVEPGWLPAAAAIDWSLPGQRIGDRKKPLADKTRRRIAAGIARYWHPFHMEKGGNQYDAADPKHPAYGDPNGYYRAWSAYDVLRTLHTVESKALVVPLEGRAGDRIRTAADPLRTQTSRHLDALATPPFMLERRFEYRTRGVDEPLAALTANDTSKALVEAPFIAELRGGGSDARPIADPMSTVTASGNHHALITRHYGVVGGDPARHTTPAEEYLRTLTGNGGNMSLLTPYYGAADTAQPTDRPIGTLTTRDRYALIQRHNTSKDPDSAEMTTPAHEYLRTLTTMGHQSLITPGDIEAAEAQVDDCLFRMLEPHEVAAGMAFPADYLWQGTRRERVKLAGNAVTPPAARDLIAAVAESLGGAA